MRGRLPLLVWLWPFALLAACSSSDDVSPPATPSEDAGASEEDAGAPHSDASTSFTVGLIKADVRRYDYAFDLAATRGKSKLTYDVVAPNGGDCIDIPSRLPVIEEPTFGGAPATNVTSAGDLLHLCSAPGKGIAAGPLAITTAADVPIKTFFDLDIGFSRQLDLAGGQFTYMLSWVGGCDRFGPCDRDPSKLVEMHFEITHPEDTVVLCPGTLTAGLTSTRCDVSGAPTYSGFGFAADPKWVRSLFAQGGGVDLVFYEVPGGKIASSLAAASVNEFLAWITTLLGPMPYGSELRVAGGPTKWLGFEHPANIILQEGIADLSTSYADAPMHVLMHEIVHQWAGDRTTLAAEADFVWKEATAEYLAYVFEDEHRPATEAASSRAYWDAIALSAQHRPRPTDNPSVDTFYGDVYGPGPMVLYVQLEALFGRPVVLAAIRSFLSTAGAKSVSDLKLALEKESGKDLTKYFEAWVVGPGAPEWPTFSIATQALGGNQLKVTVTQENASTIVYPCKVEVGLNGGSTRATVDFGLAPTSNVASTTITFAGAVTSTQLDPDHRLVGRTKTNGFAPPPPPPVVWIF